MWAGGATWDRTSRTPLLRIALVPCFAVALRLPPAIFPRVDSSMLEDGHNTKKLLFVC